MRDQESPAHPAMPPTRPDEMSVDSLNVGGYSLVIDARSPHEYADDHIPGAVNLPVVDDAQFAEVGTTYKADRHRAYVIGAQFALRNIADHVGTLIQSFPADARFLVYCYRGGKRSRAWADPLRAIGYQTDVLPGGWKAYRRAVLNDLEVLPRRFNFWVVGGATGSGKTRLLQALTALGEQVVDLEAIAAHKGSLLGLEPGRKQPTQKLFDSELLRQLRTLDPARPVWVEAESKKIGQLQIPEALMSAMNAAQRFEISAPIAERVRLLQEEYPHFTSEPAQVIEHLLPLKPLVGAKELEAWGQLAAERQIDALVTRLLQNHYDPSYGRSRDRRTGVCPPRVPIELPDLTLASIESAARSLVREVAERSKQVVACGEAKCR